MEIKGKVYCFFEQSGTFKKEFIKLGYSAEDYDIMNEFGETDHEIDLFREIEKAYDGVASIFDQIVPDDLIIAFFPCVHFCGVSQIQFALNSQTYKNKTLRQVFDNILDKDCKRHYFFQVLNKFVAVCLFRNIRMVLENSWTAQSYLRVFLKPPDIVDWNRMERGDYMKKPTAFWFWNCENTCGHTVQNDKKQKKVNNLKSASGRGMCSLDRSMLSSDYARNFICDFILGKVQHDISPSLFDTL